MAGKSRLSKLNLKRGQVYRVDPYVVSFICSNPKCRKVGTVNFTPRYEHRCVACGKVQNIDRRQQQGRPYLILEDPSFAGYYGVVLAAPLTTKLKGKVPGAVYVAGSEIPGVPRASAILLCQAQSINLTSLGPNNLEGEAPPHVLRKVEQTLRAVLAI